MKNFLYKLVFPECGKLYFGRAANEDRYRGNKPNQQFVGPHHNPEVQKLLNQGEFCFFLVVKEFETSEKVETAEDSYLKKVWKTDDWETRPRWLLNRSRRGDRGSAFGDLNFSRTIQGRSTISNRNKKRWEDPEYRERMLGVLSQPEVQKKRTESNRRLYESPGWNHPGKNQPRPDVTKETRERWGYDYQGIWNLLSKCIEEKGKRYGRNKLSKQLGVSRPLLTLMSKYIFLGLSFDDYMNSTLKHHQRSPD